MSLGAVSAHKELRPGKVEVSCEKEGAVYNYNSKWEGTTEAHSEVAMLPCSRVQPVNWPQVPRTRGTDGAAQLQCSCSCPVLGRGTQNGDCLGL